MKTLSTTFPLLLFSALAGVRANANGKAAIYSNDSLRGKEPSKTIVFIHGAFVGHQCWDNWKTYFESNGYTVYAPAWPEKNAAASVLRSRQPDYKIASIRLEQLVNYYDSIIQTLPEKPIVIGHSLGGLITQLLVQRGRAAAGVAIHSVAPKGLMTFKFSFLRSTSAALGLFTSLDKSYLMSFKKWQYAFTNGMPYTEQKAGYDLLAVPESKRALRDGLTNVAKVDFKKPHAPLLLTSGSIDHCVPASLNKKNYKQYDKHKNGSITDYKEFEGRNHFVLGQSTWKKDADYILDWINKLPVQKGKVVAAVENVR